MSQQNNAPRVTEEVVYEDDDRGGCRGCLWGVAGAAGCLVVIVVVLGLMLFLARDTLEGAVDDIFSIFNPPVNTSGISVPVVESVQQLSELTTVRHNFSNIVTSEREMPDLLAGLYGDRLVVILVGQINAGIDMSQITDEDVSVADGVLTLHLPAPTLQTCGIDESKSQVVSRDTGLFGQPMPDMDTESRRYAIRQFRELALGNGILDEAQTEAETLLQSFLGNILIEQEVIVKVTFAPIDTNAELPETCQ